MKSGKQIWSRLQPHGGTQVPKEIREVLKLKPGDVVLWEPWGDQTQVMISKGILKEVVQEWPHKANQ